MQETIRQRLRSADAGSRLGGRAFAQRSRQTAEFGRRFLSDRQETEDVGELGRPRPDDIFFQGTRAASVGTDAQRLGAEAEHGRIAGRQVDLVLDRRHLLVGVGQGRHLEEIAIRLGQQAGQTRGGQGGPANVLVVRVLHRFLVGVLRVDAGAVEAHVGSAFAVGVILHRSAAEEIEMFKPLVEQQAHAEPRQRYAGTAELHVVVHGDRGVAADRVGCRVGYAEAVLALGPDLSDDTRGVRAVLRRGDVDDLEIELVEAVFHPFFIGPHVVVAVRAPARDAGAVRPRRQGHSHPRDSARPSCR